MLCMGWRYSALAQKDKALSTWIAFGAVFLSVISIQALLSRAFANWAAPGYISLLIAVSATLVQHKQQQWLRYAIIVNLLTMGVMYHHGEIMQSLGIVRTEKNDPMRTLRAWPQLGAAVSIALAEQPHRVLLTEDRKMHTALVYYVHPSI